jgi:hypothetical protein
VILKLIGITRNRVSNLRPAGKIGRLPKLCLVDPEGIILENDTILPIAKVALVKNEGSNPSSASETGILVNWVSNPDSLVLPIAEIFLADGTAFQEVSVTISYATTRSGISPDAST